MEPEEVAKGRSQWWRIHWCERTLILIINIIIILILIIMVPMMEMPSVEKEDDDMRVE